MEAASQLRNPTALWSHGRAAYCKFQREKSRLAGVRLSVQTDLTRMQRTIEQVDKSRADLRRIRMEKESLAKHVRDLRATRQELGTIILDETVTSVTDEEKKALQKILLEEIPAQELRTLVTKKIIPDAISSLTMNEKNTNNSSGLLDWSQRLGLLIEDFNFEEVHSLLKDFIKSQQGKIKNLHKTELSLTKTLVQLKGLTRHEVKKAIRAKITNPYYPVDMCEYLTKSQLETLLDKAGDDGIEEMVQEEKKDTNDKNKRIVRTYEEYLDGMDEEMYTAYIIYTKQAEIYKKLTKPEKLILVSSLR